MNPIGSREISRKLAFFALYITDLGLANPQSLKNFGWYEGMVDFNSEDGLLDKIEQKNRNDIISFAAELYLGTIGNLKKIDASIEKYLVNWDFDRLHNMDKAILRLGTYSLMYCFDIPPEVTIFQANELADEYSEEDAYKYINGILHSVKNRFRRNFLSEEKKSFKLKKKLKKDKHEGI